MDVKAHYVSSSDATAATRKCAVQLKGKERQGQEPVHLTLVLDTSGSMDSNGELANCKRSIGFILNLMRDGDAISLVTFEDNARIYMRCIETKAENKLNIMAVVDSIVTGGCTNMSAGLLEAQTLFEAPESPRKQGIILLTDGHANRGVFKPEALLDLTKGILESRDDLTIHTIGYGSNHNLEFMSKVGEWGGGTYSVVNNLEDVATVFGSVLGSMVSTTAQNVKVVLPPGYKSLCQLPTESRSDGTTVVKVGDIQSEVGTTLLFEVPSVDPAFTLTGYDLLDHLHFQLLIEIADSVTVSPEEQENLKFAILRMEIVHLLKDVQDMYAPGASMRDGYKEEITRRLSLLETHLENPSEALAAVVAVMKNDLAMMRGILLRGRAAEANESSLMSQHASVYRVNRGTPSSQAVEPENVSTPFRNRITQRYVGAMRTLSSQVGDPA